MNTATCSSYIEGVGCKGHRDSEMCLKCVNKQPESCSDNSKVVSGGGSCNYYMVKVAHPTTLPESYTIECNDLIESLGLSFKEANIIKEIFRTANERTNGNGKPGNTEKRAAEKVLFFAIRHAISNGVDIEKFISEVNLK